ncbi:XdhC family protein [Aliamphritea spongicola]|uniref:XdhC family protein n=1 Tax=Aliamphritea spongicola TaxID=707589 RepID=UPI00196AFFBE|nr:XdhC/CoxI family protein [Aliamphritea spongicola]MBN3560842.1 XdhC family protein [Aliamphritea spongicola]
MANQLSGLLEQWYPCRDELEWVLGAIYQTHGPCYRKTGAMMLFNSLGQQFGMLSGGCLESDIQTHARRVMQTGQAVTLCYDGSDEDDLAFQLGIGCGGTVHIVLQAVTADNHYLHLDAVQESLRQRQVAGLQLQIPNAASAPMSGDLSRFVAEHEAPVKKTALITENNRQWLHIRIKPEPHLLVIGGGVDARPVVSMAKQLGWEVSLWDPRPANGRREFFPEADSILSCEVTELAGFVAEKRVSAAILMSHNIRLDAAALQHLQGAELSYMALLGPLNRKADVLAEAGLKETQLTTPVSGPAGLGIGGELPESIALSMLAECHQVLHQPKAATANIRLNSYAA